MYPMVSLNGEILLRTVKRSGPWVYIELWLPVLDAEDSVQIWRWFFHIDHDDLRSGPISAIKKSLRERFFYVFGPIAFQRLMQFVDDHLSSIDFAKLMAPEMPPLVSGMWH